MKDHLCNECFEECGEDFKVQLPNGRIIFFCSDKCIEAWEKAKEVFLKEKKGKE